MGIDLAEAASDVRKPPLAWAVVGAALVLIGAAALAGVIYISNSREASAEHAMISLGLAGSVLVSTIAECLVIVGAWMIWRTTRRRRG